MKPKKNDATLNRPLGERIVDAPAVLVHLPYYVQLIKTEKSWEESGKNGITVFKSDDLTLVLTGLKKNAKLKNIQTEGYTTLFVLEGKLNSQSGEEKISEPGDLLVFHPGITYSLFADEEAIFLLTHYNCNANGQKFIP